MRYLAKISTYITRLVAASFIIILVSTGSAFSDSGQGGNTIVGIWRTQSTSEITIVPCGTGYCGYISKVVVPDRLKRQYSAEVARMRGNILDGLNKDPSLRNRPIQGLQVLSLNVQVSTNRLNGKIYNPEDGKTYNGFLVIVRSDMVRLSGCVLFNLLCRGEDWTRVTKVSAL